MKVIIIGASLSGKTTLARYLRSNVDIPVTEIDEELTKRNGGNYPLDTKYKHEVLAPEIINDVINKNEILFLTNTDYFGIDDLKKAKHAGFEIIQLSLELEKLKDRNKKRINEGYEDLEQWLEGMVDYQNKIKKEGLVDKEINADQPTENIANEILKFDG